LALPALSKWLVRSDGNDLNGGGFVTGASGTDFSNQASPQLSNTDLVIDANNTKISSAGSPFGATSVGNFVQISAGTNFTTGFYQITAVVGALATLDRACGTAGATGGTFRMGGGLLTLAKNLTSLVAENRTYVKAGTYTITATLSIPASITGGLTWEGFGTTPGDLGTRPLITTATNSTKLFTPANQSTPYKILNIDMSNTAGTRAEALIASTSNPGPLVILEKCILDGFSVAIRGDFNGDYYFSPLVLIGVEIKNSTSHAIFQNGDLLCYDCYIHDNTGNGIFSDSNNQGLSMKVFLHTRVVRNAYGIDQAALHFTSTLILINSIFHANTNDGVRTTVATLLNLILINNLFTDNGGYGFNSSSVPQVFTSLNNAYRNNTTAARNNLAAGTNDITLSADPYTNAAGNDYTLNATAGGGAALRSAGYPASIDVGAFQALISGGGGGMKIHPGMSGGLRG